MVTKKASYPYFRHGFTIYTNNRPLAVENFVQKIFSISKNLCTFAADKEDESEPVFLSVCFY